MGYRIPESEFEILKILWRLGRATAADIRQSQDPPRDHATVSTLLRRLVDKKLVKREKQGNGREFFYQAVAKKEQTEQGLVKHFLNHAFDGSGIELVNALFQTSAPDSREIQQLQQMLDQLKAKREDSE